MQGWESIVKEFQVPNGFKVILRRSGQEVWWAIMEDDITIMFSARTDITNNHTWTQNRLKSLLRDLLQSVENYSNNLKGLF